MLNCLKSVKMYSDVIKRKKKQDKDDQNTSAHPHVDKQCMLVLFFPMCYKKTYKMLVDNIYFVHYKISCASCYIMHSVTNDKFKELSILAQILDKLQLHGCRLPIKQSLKLISVYLIDLEVLRYCYKYIILFGKVKTLK